jgi:hypothetical protein
MQKIAWNDRLSLFRKTLDHIIIHLEFRSPHECNTIAKILEQKALFLRDEGDELLRSKAEVPTKGKALRRSDSLIENDEERDLSITVE